MVYLSSIYRPKGADCRRRFLGGNEADYRIIVASVIMENTSCSAKAFRHKYRGTNNREESASRE